MLTISSTTPNGVIREVPYAVAQNFRTSRRFSVVVAGRRANEPRTFILDPIGAVTDTRLITSDIARLNRGVFIYAGDAIGIEFTAPINEVNAPLFDLCAVNPSTGVVTVQQTIVSVAKSDRKIQVGITAINATTGAITFYPLYDGIPYLP